MFFNKIPNVVPIFLIELSEHNFILNNVVPVPSMHCSLKIFW